MGILFPEVKSTIDGIFSDRLVNEVNMLDLIANITKKLETVKELLAAGEIIRLTDNVLQSKDAILTTIFDTDECLVGHAIYQNVGDSTPFHKHEGVTQYLLQYKGKVSVDFENGSYRVVDVGGCVKLDPNELHKVTGLTDGAEQIFICIPAEKGYKIDHNQIFNEQTTGYK